VRTRKDLRRVGHALILCPGPQNRKTHGTPSKEEGPLKGKGPGKKKKEKIYTSEGGEWARASSGENSAASEPIKKDF